MNRQLAALSVAGLWFSCVSLLSACGSGGGGGGSVTPPTPQPSVTGNGFAPSSGPGDTSGYLPAAAGNQWSFNFTTTDPAALTPFGIIEFAVTGTKTIQGASATVLTRTDPTVKSGGFDAYFGVSNGGITALGNTSAGDTISPLITPYVQLLFPVALGQVSSVVGTNLAAGKNSQGVAISLDITQTITNAAFETVEVPAGSFGNALKQTTTIAATAKANGQTAPVSGTETTWYVPGIGEVKDQSTASGNGTTITSNTELRGFVVNGVRHGFGAAASVVAALETDNCQPAPSGVPAVGSDGTNFLVVAHTCSNMSARSFNWMGTLVGQDGTVIKSFNITSPMATPVSGGASLLQAAIAFDGTNYLVVYEDDTSTLGQTFIGSVVISPAGALVTTPTIVANALPGDGLSSDEALVFGGGQYLLLYVAFWPASSQSELLGVFLSPTTGQPNGASFALTTTQGAHQSPAAGFDGTNFLAVWVDSGTTPSGLNAMRVSPAGALLDAMPLKIVDGSTPDMNMMCCELVPTVSFDGTNYLVAYRDPRSATTIVGVATGNASVSAARISPAGTLLDGSATVPGIIVTSVKSTPKGRISSIYTGGKHLLVWEGGSNQFLAGARVSTAGTVSTNWSDGFTLVPGLDSIDFPKYPALGAGGGGAFLVWLHQQPIPSTATSLQGMSIFSSGP
jgi:hypothetical protein